MSNTIEILPGDVIALIGVGAPPMTAIQIPAVVVSQDGQPTPLYSAPRDDARLPRTASPETPLHVQDGWLCVWRRAGKELWVKLADVRGVA